MQLPSLPLPLYALALGDFVSKTGDYIYRLAVPLLLLQVTGSPFWAGASFAVQQVGTVIAGTLSGPFIDKRSPRRVMIVVVVSMAVLTALLPLLITAVNISVALACALCIGLLLEVLNFTYRAGVFSVTPMLVGRHLLPEASAVLSVSKFASKTAGPAAAGVLIASLGVAPSLYVDAASFLALLLVVLSLGALDRSAVRREVPELHLVRDVADGLRYIARDRSLILLNAVNFVANLGYVPVLSMLIVHLTQTVQLKAATVGVIYAVDGIAALLSGLMIPWVMRRIPTGCVIALSCVALGVAIAALAMLRNPALIAMAFFFILACAQLVNRVIFTHWQMTVQPEYLSRVFGLSAALENLAAPAAALAAGIGVTAASSSGVLTVAGVLVIIAGVGGVLSPTIRRIDSRICENESKQEPGEVKQHGEPDRKDRTDRSAG